MSGDAPDPAAEGRHDGPLGLPVPSATRPDAEETIWLTRDEPVRDIPRPVADRPVVLLDGGPDRDAASGPPRPSAGTRRARLLVVGLAAVVVGAGVAVLRADVEPPPSVTAPDGEVIRAFHDQALVGPPEAPASPPPQPGEVRSDARHGGATVWWPPTSHGHEVRWGPAGQEPADTRLVATAGTTFTGLAPGRYRVDVRAIDEHGRRSEPRAAEFEVPHGAPSWASGLGFAEDLRVDGAIGLDSFDLPGGDAGCMRRAPDGALVLSGRCGETLQPAGRLLLGEPDRDGVRGRVVIVTDTPPSPLRSRGDDPGMWDNGLLVSVSADTTGAWRGPSVHLGVAEHGAHLATTDDAAAPLGDAVIENGPGVLHRWELVFTADEVTVLRNGEPIGSRPFRPAWDAAHIGVFVIGDGGGGSGLPANAHVAFLGFTGDGPDGHVTTSTRPFGGDTRLTRPGHSDPIEPAPTAESARLAGVAFRSHDGEPTGAAPLELRVEIDDVPYEVRLTHVDDEPQADVVFVADLPAAAVRRGGLLEIVAADGTSFGMYNVSLQVTHARGVTFPEPALRGAEARPEWALARPIVIVRRGGAVVGGRPFERGVVDVEIRLDAAHTITHDPGVIGWVAIRVQVDGKRVLDVPTAVDGSAVAGVYRFTLDTTHVEGSSAQLSVQVIPDRAGVTPTTERVTLRLRP